jgi:hypothetical protein
MASNLHNLSLRQDGNLISVANRGQSVPEEEARSIWDHQLGRQDNCVNDKLIEAQTTWASVAQPSRCRKAGPPSTGPLLPGAAAGGTCG